MTYDDAVAALEGAVEEDLGVAPEPSMFRFEEPVEQAPAPSAPQGESAPEGGAAPQTPVAPVAPEAPATPVDTFDDGKFNPDTLPEELQPAWHQLQAAFTRKTQSVADRTRELEQFGDIDQISQAAQLYQQLQDPSNWPRFQQEITQLMEQNGIAAPQTQQSAQTGLAFQSQQPVQPTADPTFDALAMEYPELAPLAQQMQVQQQQMQTMAQAMQQMQSEAAAREQAVRAEAQQMAAIGEFQRQEGILRQQGLGDEAMSHVYELAHAHNGNLLAAANAYEAMKSEVLAGYLQSKQQAAQDPTAPIGGSVQPVTLPSRPKNLEEAHDIAMETLKAQGLDTVDW